MNAKDRIAKEKELIVLMGRYDPFLINNFKNFMKTIPDDDFGEFYKAEVEILKSAANNVLENNIPFLAL
jgi:hypothetical protein